MTRFDTFAWLFFLTLCLPASATGGSLSEVLVNYYEHSPDMQSSAQPARDQFSAIRQAGVEIVVNLSPYYLPGVISEEKQLVEDLGMAYFHIPVNWKHPSFDQLLEFFAIMDAYDDERVLIHSWINSRSSAFIYLYRTLVLGEPDEEEHRIMSAIWKRMQVTKSKMYPGGKAFSETPRPNLGSLLVLGSRRSITRSYYFASAKSRSAAKVLGNDRSTRPDQHLFLWRGD